MREEQERKGVAREGWREKWAGDEGERWSPSDPKH